MRGGKGGKGSKKRTIVMGMKSNYSTSQFCLIISVVLIIRN